MNADLTGLVSPVLVPFDERGAVETELIRRSTEFTLDCGADAVIAAGTAVAQELTSLTVQERKDLITETVTAVGGAVPVFAGVSHPALPVVDDLIDHALEAGSDGLFLMPPWGVPPDEPTVRRYFEHVDESISIPVFLYNNPTVSVDLSMGLMADIMELESMVYVKESSRDWRKLSWLLDEVHDPGRAHVFTTLDVLVQSLEMGGCGATMPPPVTVPARRIIEAFEAGETDEALRIQRLLSRFPPGGAPLNAACKAAMAIAGCDIGGIRPPYPDVSEEVYERITDWMGDVAFPESAH